MNPCQNFPMYQTVSADYSKPGEPPPELVLLLKRHDAELSYFLPQCSIFVVKMCKSCKSVLARFFQVNQALQPIWAEQVSWAGNVQWTMNYWK